MGCQSTIRCANYCQFYSYWECQKCLLMKFSYFLFINTIRITSGRIKKKARKNVFTILQIYRWLYQRFKGVYPKKAAASKSNIQRYSLQL